MDSSPPSQRPSWSIPSLIISAMPSRIRRPNSLPSHESMSYISFTTSWSPSTASSAWQLVVSVLHPVHEVPPDLLLPPCLARLSLRRCNPHLCPRCCCYCRRHCPLGSPLRFHFLSGQSRTEDDRPLFRFCGSGVSLGIPTDFDRAQTKGEDAVGGVEVGTQKMSGERSEEKFKGGKRLPGGNGGRSSYQKKAQEGGHIGPAWGAHWHRDSWGERTGETS